MHSSDTVSSLIRQVYEAGEPAQTHYIRITSLEYCINRKPDHYNIWRIIFNNKFLYFYILILVVNYQGKKYIMIFIQLKFNEMLSFVSTLFFPLHSPGEKLIIPLPANPLGNGCMYMFKIHLPGGDINM